MHNSRRLLGASGPLAADFARLFCAANASEIGRFGARFRAAAMPRARRTPRMADFGALARVAPRCSHVAGAGRRRRWRSSGSAPRASAARSPDRSLAARSAGAARRRPRDLGGLPPGRAARIARRRPGDRRSGSPRALAVAAVSLLDDWRGVRPVPRLAVHALPRRWSRPAHCAGPDRRGASPRGARRRC